MFRIQQDSVITEVSNMKQLIKILEELSDNQQLTVTRIPQDDLDEPDMDSYIEIFKQWNTGASSNDVYHMVVDWCNSNMDSLTPSQKAFAKSILKRAHGNDSSKRIVESFLSENILKINLDEIEMSSDSD
jgi:hypothetical protein